MGNSFKFLEPSKCREWRCRACVGWQALGSLWVISHSISPGCSLPVLGERDSYGVSRIPLRLPKQGHLIEPLKWSTNKLQRVSGSSVSM